MKLAFVIRCDYCHAHVLAARLRRLHNGPWTFDAVWRDGAHGYVFFGGTC